MTPADVVQLIRHDPERLLRQASLKIFGGGVSTLSSVYRFLVIDPVRTMPGFTTGLSGLRGKKKDRPVFHLKLERKAFETERANATEDETFYAEYVAMGQVEGDRAATHRMLPATGGPGIMVTAQMSGCTFGIGSDADGSRLVSHIQPPLAEKQAPSRARLLAHATAAGFDQERPQSAFRRGQDYEFEAVILGVRRGGRWRIYAQHIDAPNNQRELARISRLL